MAHIIEITDFSAPELDIYARLTENQLVNRADPPVCEVSAADVSHHL